MGKPFGFLPLRIGSICLIVLAAGTGCAGKVKQPASFPWSYAQGFDDGCSSAGDNVAFVWKEQPLAMDPEYRYGWSDGFRQCETLAQASARKTRVLTQQQNLSQEQQTKLEKGLLQQQKIKGVGIKGM